MILYLCKDSFIGGRSILRAVTYNQIFVTHFYEILYCNLEKLLFRQILPANKILYKLCCKNSFHFTFLIYFLFHDNLNNYLETQVIPEFPSNFLHHKNNWIQQGWGISQEIFLIQVWLAAWIRSVLFFILGLRLTTGRIPNCEIKFRNNFNAWLLTV